MDRWVGIWTLPASSIIPQTSLPVSAEIPTHVNTCLLLPAQGSHELEELMRPRGHFTHLFPLGRPHPGSLSPSRIAAAFGNKDPSPSHQTPSAGHQRP